MFKALKKRSVFGISLLIFVVLALVLTTASLGAQEGLEPAGGTLTEGETFYNYNENKDAPSVPVSSLQATDADQASGRVDVRQLSAVSVIVTFDESVDASQLAAVSGGQVVHSYSKVFNGASLVVAGDKVDALAGVGGVTGIYLDEMQTLNTDASPEFIGAPAMWDALGGQESAGEGVIVGILDSGIWPEHPSVADPDPLGNAFPAPPTVPGSNGIINGPRSTCDFGDTAFNTDDDAFACNNKLIGAYDFTDTYKAVIGLIPTEFDSARDSNGHGSHTMTTAAGNAGVAAELLGVDRGTVSGIAPRAHVISYKTCGAQGCFSSDNVAAVEQAILDNVDVINYSISGGSDPYNDVVELAFSRAYENGVFVAASAGNSGPTADTVAHRGPWTTTVGASTSDRHFLSTATLVADNGDTLELVGASVTAGVDTATDVVLASDYGDVGCLSPFTAGTFSGQIVICERGTIARVAKSFNVAAGGAGGMLLYNPTNQGLATDNHFIPSVHIDGDEGVELNAFMDTHTGVTATFTDGLATEVDGDWMASFSSRGGPGQTLGISKPDITAPGVQILAGHTPLPEDETGGLPGQLFQSIQGTSMSSPHVAGSAALVAALHPDWTPGQIKSALMTTANPDHMKEDGVTPADNFDMGSGRVDLATAGNPGLTISDTTANYVALEDELWHSNYPSLYIPVMPGVINTERTVQSELDSASYWKASVETPDDVVVLVTPYLNVPAGGEATFDIRVDARNVPLGEVRHAVVTYERIGSGMSMRFPISMVRQQPAITLEHTCDPLVFARRDTTDCTISITNTTFEDTYGELYNVFPRELRLKRNSVTGAYAFGNKALYVEGILAGAEPPLVNVAVDPLASPFGYFYPLSLFGSTLEVSSSDESISNFTVPSFEFAGETYSQIGIVSNGYIIVGGGTQADVDFINTDLPDAAIPNNVLAPFWTDLNPAFGGRILLNTLTDGVNSWIVVEWEAVSNYGDGELNTFQVWISYSQADDVSFTYGDVSDGDGGFLTVGAENAFGNSGGTVYFDGVGTPPSPSFPAGDFEVDVFTVPGAPGETHTVTYTVKGVRRGEYQNCAQVTSDAFFGTNHACLLGEVTRP